MRKMKIFFLLMTLIIVLTSCAKTGTTITNTKDVDSGALTVPTSNKPSEHTMSEEVINPSDEYNILGNKNTSKEDQFTVLINEVCSKNSGSIAAKDGEYYDWVELYNPTDKAINLEGYGLSDKASQLFRYTFPKVTIPAGGYLLVYANGSADPNNNNDRNIELLTDFGISAEGETLMLSTSDGTLMDTVTVPAITEGSTYGRQPDGSQNYISLKPTPNTSNHEASTLSSHKEPFFSVESGFYKEPFELTITAAEDQRIYYTTDGTIPTNKSDELQASNSLTVSDRSKNENLYASLSGTTTGKFFAPSILINKATIIRAVAYDEEGNSSKVITKTYFVGFEDKADYYKEVAIISLVTEPEHLFDYNTGIYVTGAVHDSWLNGPEYNANTRYWHQPANYKQSGREWERPAHMEYFDDYGQMKISQEVGIRMRGGASRAFLQKSFNIYARSEYGNNRFTYELFPGLSSEYDGSVINTFKSIMLRNGGNDTELTKIREVMIHRLSSELKFSTQASKPAIVFLNGEFWGLYNLQERYSEEYIESHYGVDKDNVIIVKKDKIDEGEEADIELYQAMLQYLASNDLTISKNYETFSTMMDIESFIDYISVEILVANKDWGSNNVMLWRSRTVEENNPYGDGRWRWMLYDTEYSTGLTYENSLAYDAKYNPSSYRDNTFHTVFNPSCTIGYIFTNLIKNNTFEQQFKARFLEIAEKDFKQDTVLKLLDAYKEAYRPMMVDTTIRYSPLSEEEAIKQFDYEVSKISYFFEKRYNYIIGILGNIFH
ncbi:CotH kinase family protein [Mobilitalea sibirica]|uniref:CotH kinase family protein n=1 Tax=Mobilitalea sibirica TaxID=1462919 RepID=A0A8J7L2C6_9FIRM|nr:CotH kinase family protein [Mobilitalea sibirica]MBH1940298.1 CotH kinase family protein [Mobilitalea sibirica]